jgi:hypothetical protein
MMVPTLPCQQWLDVTVNGNRAALGIDHGHCQVSIQVPVTACPASPNGRGLDETVIRLGQPVLNPC